ncbi:hypothetical protein FKW77_010643 [Venturia effusa]|uniref:Uncharacterized protein n=1 Tax=Venturia effusa TaxID=50376 RepID=A0A517KY14_9PEZI|nr:hypothetical protein FKW77_010643 [Venturia effusa]
MGMSELERERVDSLWARGVEERRRARRREREQGRVREWMGYGDGDGGEEQGDVMYDADADADADEREISGEGFVEAEYRGGRGRARRRRVDRGELGEWEVIERGEVEGYEEFVRVGGGDGTERGGNDCGTGCSGAVQEVGSAEQANGDEVNDVQANGEDVDDAQDVDEETGQKSRELGSRRVRWLRGVDGEVSAVREFGISDRPVLIGLAEDDSWARVKHVS